MHLNSQWFQHKILTWASTHGRHDFPWQAPHTAYKTWISEIMLQQTQAPRVVDFFIRFIHAFPDVHTLAAALEDEVFHLWSGLGYYTRAQNLHKAALIIIAQHQGKIPTALQCLIALPGIGRSTAGAIRSLGHGLEGEILDGNVRRVLGRFAMIEGKPQSKAMETQYWQLVSSITPAQPKKDRDFNQAMMDLGATICTIKNPKCHQCPIQSQCTASQQQKVADYPITLAKYKKRQAIPKKQRFERRFYLFVQQHEHILLKKRPAYGIWRNLWCPSEFTTFDALEKVVYERYGQEMQIVALEPLHHQFTHFHLELNAFIIQVSTHQQASKSFEVRESQRYLWYNTQLPPNIGLASPISKLLEAIKSIPITNSQGTNDENCILS